MKKNVKITIIVSSITVLLAAILTTLLFLIPKTPSFAFYNLPESHKEIIINTIKKSIGDDISIINLDDSIPLSNQTDKIKKTSMIFTITDSDNLDFALNNKMAKAFPEELASGMPYTIVSSISKKAGGLSHLPFLYDMYQIDVNYSHFQKTSIEAINTWEDLVKTASEEITFTPSPIIFNSADDKEFLNIFGQLIEVFQTYEEYQTFYDGLYNSFKKDSASSFQTTFCVDYVNNMLQNDYNFQSTYSAFNKMVTANLINQTTLKFTQSDVLTYANNQLTGMIFSKLSDHRQISREAIGQYKTIYFPSLLIDDARKFAANEYSIILLKENKNTAKLSQDFAINLQTELCTFTGLSPVQKDCITPDRQSDDVRYWLAASSGPLLPLSAAIPDSKTQKIIANLLR